MKDVFVCEEGDLADGSTLVVSNTGAEIAVFRHDGAYYAYRNYCPHQGGPACEGVRMPKVVENIDEAGFYRGQSFDESEFHIICPWHGYAFRVTDGVNANDPKLRLKKFDVTVQDGRIYVRI